MNKLYTGRFTQPARTNRKFSRFWALLITLSATTALHGAPLQDADDFMELSQSIQEKKVPLLLVIEAEHCNYCKRLKAEQLLPINNNEDYQQKVMIRTIKMDSASEIVGFDGKKTTPAKLSSQYKAFLTPTLLFLNEKGEEVTKRILGYNSPDYYGLYLDQAIDTAGEKISGVTN
ncbi:MAG: thioredoxin fold domain-containing protein [Thiolinea sp.]